MTKSNTGISHSASLILHARRIIEDYPSIAEDTGTPERNAIHLLNRVTNKISCAVEVSSNMAAYALLGGPSEFVSCSFFHVFVLEAIAFAQIHPNYEECLGQSSASEFDDIAEFLDDEEFPFTSETYDQDESDSQCNLDDLYNEDINPEFLESTGENDELDSTSSHSSAKVYTTSNGRVAVPQIVHYCYRGSAFLDYSLHSYAALIDVIMKPKKNSNQSVQSDSNHTGRGRPKNGMFEFSRGHPLFQSHIQRLRSKPKVPVPRNVPRPPPKKPRILNNSWKNQATNFSRYFLALFKPWTYPTRNGGTLPGPLTWNFFCAFISKLENGNDGSGPTFFERVTIRWIRSMAFGLRTSAQDRAAVQDCRSRAVKTWKELAKEPESSLTSPILSQNTFEENIEEEQNLELISQMNIELLLV